VDGGVIMVIALAIWASAIGLAWPATNCYTGQMPTIAHILSTIKQHFNTTCAMFSSTSYQQYSCVQYVSRFS